MLHFYWLATKFVKSNIGVPSGKYLKYTVLGILFPIG